MSTLYQCPNHIEVLEMDQEWIVMDTERFTITKINSMGAYILNMIKEKKQLEDIVEWIDRNYAVDLDAARDDALAFLEELAKVGLIIHERV